MSKTALILIRNELLKNNILPFEDAAIKMINVVHDEILLESSSGYQELAAKILQESMETAGSYFCTKVNMTAEPVISSHWKH